MKTSVVLGILCSVVLINSVALAQACPFDVFDNHADRIDRHLNPMTPAAVTEAMDFTKNDCDGVEHHLYSELEAGKVILLHFSMNCPSCENSRVILEDVEAQFSDSHPGRFHIYTMSYMNSVTCEKMKLWPVVKNHENPVFTGVADQLSYYGGFGMPTIVIAGGKDHKTFYVNTKGISDPQAELVKIKAAISEALSTSSVEGPELSDASFVVFPNPAHDKITLSLPQEQGSEVHIINYMGLLVRQETVNTSGSMTLDIGNLEPGAYRITLAQDGRTLKTAVFVKY